MSFCNMVSESPVHIKLDEETRADLSFHLASSPRLGSALRSVRLTAQDQAAAHVLLENVAHLLRAGSQVHHVVVGLLDGEPVQQLHKTFALVKAPCSPAVSSFRADCALPMGIPEGECDAMKMMLPSLRTVSYSVPLAGLEQDGLRRPCGHLLRELSAVARAKLSGQSRVNHTLHLSASLCTPGGQDTLPDVLVDAVQSSHEHLTRMVIQLTSLTPALPRSIGGLLAPCHALQELELPCSSASSVDTVQTLFMRPDIAFRLRALTIRCVSQRIVLMGGIEGSFSYMMGPVVIAMLSQTITAAPRSIGSLRKLVLYWFSDAESVGQEFVSLCRARRIQLQIKYHALNPCKTPRAIGGRRRE
ncbi:hypothetical protein BKA62DRAFT_710438 [Auriculariales sp. MPI-PUGE-AT-0066]|nr:hypothetical protein BKA62DRAFT_710438 [Auriculariales sp. MPI-PUGE-AT-0066]